MDGFFFGFSSSSNLQTNKKMSTTRQQTSQMNVETVIWLFVEVKNLINRFEEYQKM